MARFRSAVVPWDSAVTSEMQGGCAARTLAGSVEKAEGGSCREHRQQIYKRMGGRGRGEGERERGGGRRGKRREGFVGGCRGWTCPGAYEVGPERPAQYFIITLTRW